jgi:chemotaxis protein CheY-P-specific phosphatase CheC
VKEERDGPEQALLRLIETGVSNSADKLAKISKTDWSTQTVSIKTAPLERFQDTLVREEKEQCCAYFTMPGGVFLVMFPERSGTAFADIFLPINPKNPVAIKNRELETLAEISNIVVNTVAATIADACDTAFFLSTPKMSQGKKRDLLAAAPGMVTPAGEKFTVMAYVHMSSETLSSDCNMFFLLNAVWKERLLSALE